MNGIEELKMPSTSLDHNLRKKDDQLYQSELSDLIPYIDFRQELDPSSK